MQPEFWKKKWEAGTLGFHQEKVHPALEMWGFPLLEGTGSSVLIPLAGKSWDIHHLATRGHHVTAVELSSLAAQQFHDEQGRSASRQARGPFEEWSSERCDYLVGDVFRVKEANLPPQDFIWDRAALVALAPEQRARYGPLLLSLLRPGGILLLNVFRYPRGQKEGPPHSIEEHEVFSLFGKDARIELLESRDRIEEETRWKEMGFPYWITSTWKITRR